MSVCPAEVLLNTAWHSPRAAAARMAPCLPTTLPANRTIIRPPEQILLQSCSRSGPGTPVQAAGFSVERGRSIVYGCCVSYYGWVRAGMVQVLSLSGQGRIWASWAESALGLERGAWPVVPHDFRSYDAGPKIES